MHWGFEELRKIWTVSECFQNLFPLTVLGPASQLQDRNWFKEEQKVNIAAVERFFSFCGFFCSTEASRNLSR